MPAATATEEAQAVRSTIFQPAVLPSEVLLLAESQWLFTEDELLRTPSILEGLPPKTEREYRSKGVNFILQVGIMLKLPQITLATASVFLHRFYVRHPMQTAPGRGYHHYEVGATSLFLATKVEENCRKMKELVIACVRVAQKDPHKVVDEQDKEYWRWRDVILFNEDVMLEAVCFDLSLEPPHKIFFDLLMLFGEEYAENKRLRNAAWAFINDSCLTTLCLLYPSKTIASSALYTAARFCDVAFPDDERGRPWWDVLHVKLADIIKACNYMADIYEGSPSKASRPGGMYERTPEPPDEANDRTRAAAPGMLSPSSDIVNGAAVDPISHLVNEERRQKREFEETIIPNGTGHITNGDDSGFEGQRSPRKRQKVVNEGTDHNGTAAPAVNAQPNGTATQMEESNGGGLVSPKLEDDVEEGEVAA